MKYLIIILVLAAGCSSEARIARWSDNLTAQAMKLPQGSPERTGRLVAADILTHDNDIVFAQHHYPEVTQQTWAIVLDRRKFTHSAPDGFPEPPHRTDNNDMTHWDISCEVLLYIRTHPITVGEIEIAARESQGRIE